MRRTTFAKYIIIITIIVIIRLYECVYGAGSERRGEIANTALFRTVFLSSPGKQYYSAEPRGRRRRRRRRHRVTYGPTIVPSRDKRNFVASRRLYGLRCTRVRYKPFSIHVTFFRPFILYFLFEILPTVQSTTRRI